MFSCRLVGPRPARRSRVWIGSFPVSPTVHHYQQPDRFGSGPSVQGPARLPARVFGRKRSTSSTSTTSRPSDASRVGEWGLHQAGADRSRIVGDKKRWGSRLPGRRHGRPLSLQLRPNTLAPGQLAGGDAGQHQSFLNCRPHSFGAPGRRGDERCGVKSERRDFHFAWLDSKIPWHGLKENAFVGTGLFMAKKLTLGPRIRAKGSNGPKVKIQYRTRIGAGRQGWNTA